MSTDLLRRYGARFVRSARERLAAATELGGEGAVAAARTLALHLHSISGEAAMIGLAELSQLARAAMAAARAVEGGTSSAGACAEEIGRVAHALDELEASISAGRQP